MRTLAKALVVLQPDAILAVATPVLAALVDGSFVVVVRARKL
jgi:hypothetical protein